MHGAHIWNLWYLKSKLKILWIINNIYILNDCLIANWIISQGHFQRHLPSHLFILSWVLELNVVLFCYFMLLYWQKHHYFAVVILLIDSYSLNHYFSSLLELSFQVQLYLIIWHIINNLNPYLYIKELRISNITNCQGTIDK